MIHVDDARFQQLVHEGVLAIDEKFRSRLNNVQIIIEDAPSPRQRRDNDLPKNATLLGLYEGVPLTEREHYTLVLPDKITIFKTPIEEMAATEEDVKAIVADTVWHEIGHHFGLDETEVRRREHPDEA